MRAIYLYVFKKLIVTIDMDSGEFSDFIEFKFYLNRLTVPCIISPTNPSLS